ncbi:hypothetical protein GCM10028803_36980 [Larkinella knui]|uniref:Uncharacterized protein n=1 Tax=Larkinella knui TaxID=2025310 RepID=A0A3P1CE13_9BACT|nr:hypothetical protein [Larkinella knui]RRB11552.1 hypothetical protein EHT87_24070 [Larkinella knui]
MERFLTVLAAALCAAPLFFIVAIRWLIPAIKRWFLRGADLDFSGSLSLGAGIALGSFILIGSLAWFFSGRGYLRPTQMITGLMMAGWCLAWVVFAWNEPHTLDYHGKRAVLDAEIRIDKSLLNGRPLKEAVALSFTGGDFDRFHWDQVRHEGGFVVLPWEITVHTVYHWAIWSTVDYKKSYFELDLPYRPSHSTDWSGWAAPTAHEGAIIPPGLTLRYRLNLLAQSETSP